LGVFGGSSKSYARPQQLDGATHLQYRWWPPWGNLLSQQSLVTLAKSVKGLLTAFSVISNSVATGLAKAGPVRPSTFSSSAQKPPLPACGAVPQPRHHLL
jgi:hypothetical protein